MKITKAHRIVLLTVWNFPNGVIAETLVKRYGVRKITITNLVKGGYLRQSDGDGKYVFITPKGHTEK